MEYKHCSLHLPIFDFFNSQNQSAAGYVIQRIKNKPDVALFYAVCSINNCTKTFGDYDENQFYIVIINTTDQK